ncbi:MAG: hypothetical protein COV66_06250 [Nitrospinae bacterium CG11_big_fil_rev_8_21_14_0_20_45_15]|nr:MAG: hypothetical protein COV66_06250 [Nitrospinae bacterium CG11_big_fil_rev_8_21_14_0_20_45_15]
MTKTVKNYLIAILFIFSFVSLNGNVFLEDAFHFSPTKVWAGDDKDKDKDNDSEKDKDKDTDENIDFNYNDTTFSQIYSPCAITKFQLEYDKDFIATDNVNGPNILVEGTDNGICVLEITKISGGSDCGWNVSKTAVNLAVQTDARNGANDCEMQIKATMPRTVLIVPLN